MNPQHDGAASPRAQKSPDGAGRAGMRLSSTWGEAWRNLLGGTSRALLWALLLALSVGTLAALDERAVASILRGGEEFREAGGATQVLSAPGGIDAARCEALSRTPGVKASGALRPTAASRLAALPATEVPTFEVTTGMAALLETSDDTAGVLLPATLDATLGHPSEVTLRGGASTAVAGVYDFPEDGREATLAYALLTPAPALGAFDACWITIWPPDPALAGLARFALLPSDPTQPVEASQRQLNARLGETYDTHALLATRITRPAHYAAAFLGLVLGFAALRARRLELASARHAGVSAPALALQGVIETAAWALAGALLAVPALSLAARAPGIDTATVWRLGLLTLAAGAAATLPGAVLATLLTRERHLFRYFKDR